MLPNVERHDIVALDNYPLIDVIVVSNKMRESGTRSPSFSLPLIGTRQITQPFPGKIGIKPLTFANIQEPIS